MFSLLDAVLDWFNNNGLISAISTFVTLVGSYFILRERVVKTELKYLQSKDHTDSQVQILKNELDNIKEDINDFKELNKETSRSLGENTSAIRELKLVLELLREQINLSKH